MATAGNASSAGGESNAADSSNVPQWKRDLILRRRQQNKVLLSSNGANVKFLSTEGVDVSVVVCRQEQRQDTSSTTTTTTTTTTRMKTVTTTTTTTTTTTREEEKSRSGINETGTIILADAASGVSSGGTEGGMGSLPIPTTMGSLVGRELASGANLFFSTNNCENDSVARNMRLEADLSLCSDSEDVNGSGSGATSGATSGGSIKSTDIERKMEHGQDDYESDDNILGTRRTRDVGNNLFEEFRGNTTSSTVRAASTAAAAAADAESDSSEELQYGPGIVNKLKSKYLNLALRETNKSRATVQRFRRAASLEDLLDREEESSTNEKNATIVVSDRKYAKRNVAGQTSKTTGGDRYRNASRNNETTMKRARSVETLVRYNVNSSSIDDSNLIKTSTNARIASRQEDPINDHIVLVDRSTVKIESRLSDIVDRPKATNKPKRIKPVLAETERPPPDLVKTTMRIFEGSAKKLKPKGDVAAKVATFKTINDTFKAQNQKKVLPKPPLQPKPFANGNTRTNTITNSSSPKKIILPQKPTAELIEKDEEFHFDGVITDPIVQSVSSVVSKFQKIEKSHSPSPSPEPTFNKLRYSPAPSPEPQNRSKLCALEIGIKSPPLTPLLSPRISSPAAQSPSSPIKDANIPLLQSSSPIRKSSPIKENLETSKVIQTRTRQAEKEMILSTRQRLPSPKKSLTTDWSIPKDLSIEELEPEIIEVESQEEAEAEVEIEEEEESEEGEEKEEKEIEKSKDVEDGPKTISSSALDNISKAGTTMHFRFKDEFNNREKNYLPGVKQYGSRKVEEKATSVVDIKTNESFAGTLRDQEIASRLFREKLAIDKDEKKKNEGNDEIEEKKKADNKPPKSASLISSTTTTSYSQGNESKTIRCQKSESSPPQKQIGIIRPLVSTKTQLPQQNLSNRELEKNLINRVKSIEQPTKVVVSLKSADEIQPTKKSTPTVGTGIGTCTGTGTGTGGGGGCGGGGGLWDAKPWNQQNNTMVFNFSNRKDVPDYIENDGLIIKRKREKSKVGDGSIIVLDATLDASTTDDSEWELSGGPPSPCDVSFLNDNILINGRSNLSRTPRNHKHRIQFDDMATRTFEYPSEASMLEGESNIIDNESSTSGEQSTQIINKTSTAGSTTSIPSLLGGGGLASYTPSKVDLASESFELGVTRATLTTGSTGLTTTNNANGNDQQQQGQNTSEVDYLKPAQDGNAWGSETTGDLLY